MIECLLITLSATQRMSLRSLWLKSILKRKAYEDIARLSVHSERTGRGGVARVQGMLESSFHLSLSHLMGLSRVRCDLGGAGREK
ncbi:MAG: hypothetical protein RL326_2199 [Pseudomonadota bacterium]|jgi:hypothetical protein